jgi:transaldolase/glucose-6-phosphate isomerase
MTDRFDEVVDHVAGLVDRVWARDRSVWQADPQQVDPGDVEDRLGWLTSTATSRVDADEWQALAAGMVADGITDVVLLGMGGASLYPLVLASLVEDPLLRLHVLDTTHPDAVQRMRQRLDPATWAVVASSKTGTTIETTSLLARFHADLVAAVGASEAARRVVVITDVASDLATWGHEVGVRAVVEVPSDVGGHFGALAAFGMVPAAMLGVDVAAHLDAAADVEAAARSTDMEVNDPARLGAFMGAAARSGHRQLTIVLEPEVAVFGLWIEQLVATSTGKGGTGLLPVVDEPVREPVAYGPARALVAVGEHHGIRPVAESGTPVAVLDGFDVDRLAREVFRWEFATTVACAVMGVDPFSQPDVEAAREAARQVEVGRGRRPRVEPADDLVDGLDDADFLCLLAFVDPEGPTATRLDRAAATLARRFGIPVTVGLGPRYLHSTGQLHKGGPPGGAFAVLLEPGDATVEIPGRDVDFTTLLMAQAAGDVEALRAAGRTVAVVRLDDLLDA